MFLEKAMLKMGFVESLVDLILRCISLTLVSNEISFARGRIKGAKVCHRRPIVTYLLFVDNCILFGDVKERGAQNLKTSLREYEI
ncbi:reverse transcriptase [Gossypium australe]|uniref:Reverse transcriptase n=1 Tax=Gossypium australe TaxID=47621 RepID=A0A5B6VM23_9ROSI|nr:reverse transcriptase [Gossypium australe]